jgi:hypothetical protein
MKPTTHTTSVASLLCNTLPPSKEDPIHVKYQKSLVSFQNTTFHSVSPEVYKPIDYKKIKLSNPPADVLRLMENGVVWDCPLHMIAVSQGKSKYV